VFVAGLLRIVLEPQPDYTKLEDDRRADNYRLDDALRLDDAENAD